MSGMRKLELSLRGEDPEAKGRSEAKWSERVQAGDLLVEHRQILIEIMLVRHVENYLSYLSLLLYEIFTQRPETLKSSDKVEVASVLSHDSIEGLIRSVAERKVESLSYQSFNDLSLFFEERFNITLLGGKEFSDMVETIEIRNISVHNRCVINSRFVTRTRGDEDTIGKRKELFFDTLDSLIPMIAKSVVAVDKRARSHLGLRGIRFK
jgi:hypothetical protein